MSYTFESIAQLEHSKEFAKLHKKFHQFNPLKVLRVSHFEIRLSNVLGWLIDPDENHQFGSFFIKKLLSRLITRSENEEKLETIDYLPFLYSSLTDAVVYREVKTSTGRFIDLLVELPSLKVILIIENKFHALESENQLKDYLNYIKTQYSDYTIVPIYLTLASDAPSHPDYWSLDYHDVMDIITQHLELNSEVIADNIHDFLSYYTAILREELVEDNESIEMALKVYQMNQKAIDLLFVSQHQELRKQPRFKELYIGINDLSVNEQSALKRIYEKKKKTIDYIFTIGSNVLRQAFLKFAHIEELPEEVYNAHIRVPNFILPEWLDFEDIVGKPEAGYWLGSGLIIWFERTWNDFLKINVEIGPVPYENRLQLLSGLEDQGVSFRPSAKLEGKKYTKIYTELTYINDWANKQEIVEGMEKFYNNDSFNELLAQIAAAIENLKGKEKGRYEVDFREESILDTGSTQRRIPRDAFIKFVLNQGISEEYYKIQSHNASFLVPVFRDLEKVYGPTRMKWWWHDSTFTYWFERLKDGRLKLILELGPLVAEKRLLIVKQLEEMGVSFSVKSKQPTARYTRIFSDSTVINNWEDVEEVYQAMEELFGQVENRNLLTIIKSLG